jgi:hypothetical protein
VIFLAAFRERKEGESVQKKGKKKRARSIQNKKWGKEIVLSPFMERRPVISLF